jgi:hypothetical protein
MEWHVLGDLRLESSLAHTPFVDDARRESEALCKALQDADHGAHVPSTMVLSRRELDKAKEVDWLRWSAIGPIM